MRTRAVLVVAVLCLVQGVGFAQRASVFGVEGRAATRAAVTVGDGAPVVDAGTTPMLLALDGVLAVYEGRGVGELRATQERGTDDANVVLDVPRVCTVYLGRGDLTARVDVFRLDDGRYVGGRVVDGAVVGPVARLDGERFATLAQTWEWRAAAPFAEIGETGRVVELSRPYKPGRFVLDGDVLSERLFGGRKSRIAGAERSLAGETLYARVPVRPGPTGRYGVLVWLDPSPSGRPPGVFFEACDELGLICVGAGDAGNDRPAVDRMQLAFDGLATVGARYPIDHDRVYLAGMSGGGRLATMLWATFPDVFAGAVPIVGANHYEQISIGNGKAWPAAFVRPRGERLRTLKTRRVAPMTGPIDFNYEQIRAYAEAWEDDGLAVRVFEYEDMAHVMPRPDRFGNALRWVDEPWREQFDAHAEGGERLLEAYLNEHGEGVPQTDEQRAALVAITEEAPWTEPALRAAALLGYPVPALGE